MDVVECSVKLGWFDYYVVFDYYGLFLRYILKKNKKY